MNSVVATGVAASRAEEDCVFAKAEQRMDTWTEPGIVANGEWQAAPWQKVDRKFMSRVQ